MTKATWRLTVAVENRVYHKKLKAEEGVSFVLERVDAQARAVLFDTGRSGDVLVGNLRELGYRGADIGHVVLSHGHDGHVGGTAALLAFAPDAKVVLHPDIFRVKYKQDSQGRKRVAAAERLRIALGSQQPVMIEQPYSIGPGLTVLPPAEAPCRHRVSPKYMVESSSGEVVPDTFAEELSLAVNSQTGVTLITSCCHRGLECLIDSWRSTDPVPVERVVGGLHLGSDEVALASVGALASGRQLELVTGHCTGADAECALRASLGERLVRMSCGDRFFI